MVGLASTLVDEATLPNAPSALASHKGSGLLLQKSLKLISFLKASNVTVHVDFVPESSAKSLARNQQNVNLVPEISELSLAPNQHNVVFVPEKSDNLLAPNRHQRAATLIWQWLQVRD
jgi:hypothetical protein